MASGGTEDLDFKDLTEQINDYEKALIERMQAYHEGKCASKETNSRLDFRCIFSFKLYCQLN